MTTRSVTSPTHGCGQEAIASQCGQEPAASSCGQGVEDSCGQARSPQLLDHQEMAAWRAFLTASVTVTARLNHELEAGADISMHEYEVLVRLSEAPDRTMRMSTLAEHVAHSRSRLTHTVGRLEKAGHVERTSCPADRRGVNCHLTEAGLGFLREVAPIHLDGVRRHVIERLDRDQLADFTRLLSALVEVPGA